MSDPRDVEKIFVEAKQQVANWPSWMKDQEPPPGHSYQEWALSQSVVSCPTEDE